MLHLCLVRTVMVRLAASMLATLLHRVHTCSAAKHLDLDDLASGTTSISLQRDDLHTAQRSSWRDVHSQVSRKVHQHTAQSALLAFQKLPTNS